MKTTIELIKNRSDIGAGTRGSDLGVDAIEIAAINRGSDFFQRYAYVDVPTRNEVVYHPEQYPYAKHIPQVYLQCEALASIVEACRLRGSLPLVLSGDHSSALGTIAGISHAHPQQRLGILWIDAHADIHSPYTTPSGNMHGMPLAAALQLDNRAAQLQPVDATTSAYWQKMKNLVAAIPPLTGQQLFYLGIRDMEAAEEQLIDQHNIAVCTVAEFRHRGIGGMNAQLQSFIAACDMLYISLDVDSMDSEKIADGTGTPVPQGFFPEEIKAILEDVCASKKVVCLEVVEVNPLLDQQGNKMAEVTFDILDYISHKL